MGYGESRPETGSQGGGRNCGGRAIVIAEGPALISGGGMCGTARFSWGDGGDCSKGVMHAAWRVGRKVKRR
jgi:hypothetical protein